MTIGREYITIVEIDVDFCDLTFGSSPCTAALSSTVARKCFNTRATCKDLANIDLGTLTLRFAGNQSGLPKGQTIFPALKSVSERAGEINLSGLDDRTSALGKRASVTVQVQDFTYHDTLTDKYQSERVSGAAQQSGVGYDPAAQGTFFGRLRARWPHWYGRALRVKRGVVGQALAAMETEHYVLTDWKGPDANGAVTFTAKDVLKLAEDDNALCPAPSNGVLAEGITITATEATLSPSGIGDAEYAASGRVCIGSEVMTFTRSGDTLTLTGRGVDGTTAAAHSADDSAQECYHVSNAIIPDVLEELLVTYAGISSGFIPTADWTTENHWTTGFGLTTTITRPTAVSKLVGEICQLGVSVWWEPTAQEIRYRPNRPLEADETFFQITDAANILEGSGQVEVSEGQRIGTIFFWHGLIDPTDSATDGNNYRKALVRTSTEAANFETSAFKEIYTRWFGPEGDDPVAATIAERLISRYERAPLTIQVDLDIKDRESVRIGDLVQVTSRLIQDDAGAGDAHTAQVKFVKPGAAKITIKGETYDIEGRFGYWMTDASGLPDYDTATDEEKTDGAFWFDDAETDFGDGTTAYIWF